MAIDDDAEIGKRYPSDSDKGAKNIVDLVRALKEYRENISGRIEQLESSVDGIDSAIQSAVSEQVATLQQELATVDSRIASAVAAVRNQILDGVGEDFDTLMELAQAIGDNADLIGGLQDVAKSHVSYTKNTVTVAGVTKELAKLSPMSVLVLGGLVMGGTAAEAGLVTRGICGCTTPTTEGAASKDHLYINYDSTNTFTPARQLVLQAGGPGEHLGQYLYTYAVPRGDIVKAFCDAHYLGIDARNNLFPYSVIKTATDANTFTDPGVYRLWFGGTTYNLPVSEWGTLVVYNGSGDTPAVMQEYIPDSTVTRYIRRKGSGGGWSAWSELVSTTRGKATAAASADTATKATQDASGNVITDTYLTKTAAASTYLGKTAKAESAKTADSVGKLTTARNIYLSGGASSSQPTFDGSSNVNIAVSSLSGSHLVWGTTGINGNISPLEAACCDEFGHNKLAFLPAGCIDVEYTTDGGATWEDYGLTDSQKVALVSTTGPNISIGKGIARADKGTLTNENCGNYQCRVTIGTRDKDGIQRVYTSSRRVLMNYSSNGAAGGKIKIEIRTIGDYLNNIDNWKTIGTYDVSGWSGWNSFPFSASFGGSPSQTTQTAQIRFTLSVSSVNTGYSSNACIIDIRLIGVTNWGYPSEMARAGHLYQVNTEKEAIFPASITAPNFIGLASKATADANGNNIATTYAKKTDIPVPLKGDTGPQGPQGVTGPRGYTFTPSVSAAGVLSWTNNGGLDNPASVTIKGADGAAGPQGPQGPKGDTGSQGPAGPTGPRGYTFTPSVSAAGVLSWSNNGGLSNPASFDFSSIGLGDTIDLGGLS